MKFVVVIAFVVLLLPSRVSSQTVHSYPLVNTPLEERWTWAQNQHERSTAVWVMYSFKKEMCERCFIGSFNASLEDSRKQLGEVVLGWEKPTTDLNQEIKQAIQHIDNYEQKLVEKSIVMMFQIEAGMIQKVAYSTMDSRFNFEGLDVYWLGEVDPKKSQEWLMSQYHLRASKGHETAFIWAIGIHPPNPDVLSFLKTVAFESNEADRTKAALFSMGSLHSESAVTVLSQFLRLNKPSEVKKSALFALGNSKIPAARDVLIRFIETESKSN